MVDGQLALSETIAQDKHEEISLISYKKKSQYGWVMFIIRSLGTLREDFLDLVADPVSLVNL